MSARGRFFEALGWALGLALGLGLVIWGATWVGNFIEDDALISLRYAYRFLEGKGLTWNDGERVEGYSNLAWVLSSAALGAFGTDLILAARILSFSCWAVTFGALLMLARRVGAKWSAFGAASVALGATASLSVWAMGGLEQPLVVACLAIALWAQAELVLPREPDGDARLKWAALEAGALSLLVLTRPDGPLFVVVLAAATFFMVKQRADLRAGLLASVVVAGVPFLAWLAQLGFRLAYYDEWVPNTAHIKTHLTGARMRGGLGYVARGLGVSWLISVAGIVGALLALLRRETRGLAATVLVVLLTWTGYVVVIGGDHFPAFRHLLPTQLCWAALLVLGLSAWTRATGPQSWTPAAAFALACLLAVPYVWTQREIGEVNVAKRARWQWDGQAVGRTFGLAFADQAPLWAVTAAGCLPYFSALPALDLLGLNDAHIARQPPDLSLSLSHDHGDGQYVLERAPDLITFGLPRGGRPVYKSGREMARDRRFSREYQRVTFRTLGPVSVLSDTYVRRQGRVGLTGSLAGGPRDEGLARLILPAYLLRGTVGHPLPDGSLGALLERQKNTTVDLPSLPTGQYRMRLEPENSRVEVRLVARRGRSMLPNENDPYVFSLIAPAPLRLEVRAPHLSTLVGSVIIERVAALPTGAHDTTTARKSLLLQAAAQGGELNGAGRSFSSKSGFGDWTVTGEAFGSGPSTKERRGQDVVEGARGPFFNSFVMTGPEVDGDIAQGVLASPSFAVREGSWLELRVGGGRAEVQGMQVGVRVIDLSAGEAAPRMVFTGQGDERLRVVRTDLSPLAGRTVRLEVFDESSAHGGHVVADGFMLHEPR